MQNNLATKKDLEQVKNELLDKLVDKDRYQKDMARLVTKEEFKEELARLVTKEEFKEELARLVTKDDLKTELSKYATKDDLRFEISTLRKDIREMDERHSQKYNKILEILDGIAGQLSNNRIEKAASEATFQRHEITLDDHERRIKQLEMEIA